MGHKKRRMSKKEYNRVRNALIIFTAMMGWCLIILPCVFPSPEYNELTDATITIDSIKSVAASRYVPSYYIIIATDGNRYYVNDNEGRKAITRKEIKEGDICSVKFAHWNNKNKIKELKIGDVEYISYAESNPNSSIIAGIVFCLIGCALLCLWRKYWLAIG